MTVATTPVYELWDVEAGNLISDHEDEAAALRSVREGVGEDGPDAWAAVALVRVEPGGMRAPVAQGDNLIRRARGEGTPPSGPPGAASVGTTVARALPDFGVSTFAAELAAKSAAEWQETVARLMSDLAPQQALVRLAVSSFDELFAQLYSPRDFSALLGSNVAESVRAPLVSEIARNFHKVAGALAFGEVFRSFPLAGKSFASLYVQGLAKIEIGPEESVLEVPATEEVVERLVEERAIPPVAAMPAPPRIIRLRVRVEGYRFEWDSDDDVRATGD